MANIMKFGGGTGDLRQITTASTTLGRSQAWTYTMPYDGYMIGTLWGSGASSQDNSLYFTINGTTVWHLSNGYAANQTTFVFRKLNAGDVLRAWCPSDNYWAGIKVGFYTTEPE